MELWIVFLKNAKKYLRCFLFYFHLKKCDFTFFFRFLFKQPKHPNPSIAPIQTPNTLLKLIKLIFHLQQSINSLSSHTLVIYNHPNIIQNIIIFLNPFTPTVTRKFDFPFFHFFIFSLTQTFVRVEALL